MEDEIESALQQTGARRQGDVPALAAHGDEIVVRERVSERMAELAARAGDERAADQSAPALGRPA
jgi:hypothetical protein